MFHKMPFILLAVLGSIFILDPWISPFAKSILFAASLSIKSAIIFILPAIIFMLLFKTMAKLASKATKMILILLVGVCCSNFLSTMISYQVGSAIYQMGLSIATPDNAMGLEPYWTFSLPKWIGNDQAMFSGLILGIFLSFISPKWSDKVSEYFDIFVEKALKVIICVIPVFIAGFGAKLIHDKVLESIVRDYAWIFILVGAAQLTYVTFIYLIANEFKLASFMKSIKNMLPAAITGFGSMSSAAAMPLTIIGTEKNTQNPFWTRLVIPTTVNVHLIGDCFAIPIFAFAVMKNFGMAEPTFGVYVVFALYFVLAKFSVAAIPGGGILVMLPVLENQLGFNAEMASLITALYILFDPVITCANVMGNGAFALATSKLQKSESATEPVPV